MSLLQNSNAVTPSAGYNIDNSCRFNEPDSPYLSRTPASASNRKTWTISCWVKLTGHDNAAYFMDAGSNPNYVAVSIYQGEISIYDPSVPPDSIYIRTVRILRDPAAWYHVVVQLDTTQATSTDRVKIYVNNERITETSNTVYPPQNYDSFINNNIEHTINKSGSVEGAPYMAEYHFIDGIALTPSSFAEADEDTNEWKAIKYDGSYGTNGFFLEFKNSGALGTDTSGEGNTWASTNLVATDQMIDSPTNNFATLNPLQSLAGGYSCTMTEGNLKNSVNQGGLNWPSTFAVPNLDQKWYWEVYNISGGSVKGLSVMLNVDWTAGYENYASYFYRWQGDSGIKKSVLNTSAETTANGTLLATGDIGAIFVNGADLQFYKNGSLVYTATDACSVSEGCNIIIPGGYGSNSTVWAMNFGQDSSFAGEKTSGSANATDANGIGDFYYTPPAGALAFCTKNLSDPAIALSTDHFNPTVYTGNNTVRDITDVGFQSDFTWIKDRIVAYSHAIFDSVRGDLKRIQSNNTNAEQNATDSVSFGNANGFSLGNDAGDWGVNKNTNSYVAWNWKAGTSVSGTTGGAGTGTAYSGSASATAGFSIIKYVGNSTAGHGIPHHLAVAPDMFIVKNRDDSGTGWMVYHKNLTSYLYFIALDGTGAEETVSNDRWYSVPDATYNYLQQDLDVNEVNEADNYIMYSFASIEGYSKVGMYIGNNNADGPFIYTGFRPAMIIIKRFSAAGNNWLIFDSTRNPYNAIGEELYPDEHTARWTGPQLDFLSNGVKLRNTYTSQNASGGKYLYLAFAESPFKTSRAR